MRASQKAGPHSTETIAAPGSRLNGPATATPGADPGGARGRGRRPRKVSTPGAHLAAIDTEIGKRLAEDAALTRRAEILTSIPGVSRITATGLLIQMPELGRLDAKAVASLAGLAPGLAPFTRQSGTWQGRSFIQAGRTQVRRILYMPTVTAMRCNPDLRAKYRQLVAQGKPGKVALVAVMRKLLVLANALLEQDRTWSPERPGQDRTASAGDAPLVAA